MFLTMPQTSTKMILCTLSLENLSEDETNLLVSFWKELQMKILILFNLISEYLFAAHLVVQGGE